MTLKGKVALVTGAAQKRSIGWGIAHALALAGADVAVNDAYHFEELEARAADLKALGCRSLAVRADVTGDEQVVNMVEEVMKAFGHLDIVVSNAGIARWERFGDVTRGNLRDLLRVNILGNANVCRAAAKQMVAQGKGGSIITVSSVQSDVQLPIMCIRGNQTRHARLCGVAGARARPA